MQKTFSELHKRRYSQQPGVARQFLHGRRQDLGASMQSHWSCESSEDLQTKLRKNLQKMREPSLPRQLNPLELLKPRVAQKQWQAR